jgi:hypothetical protein
MLIAMEQNSKVDKIMYINPFDFSNQLPSFPSELASDTNWSDSLGLMGSVANTLKAGIGSFTRVSLESNFKESELSVEIS